MITIRKSEERGHFDHGWLNTYQTFSFASYHDPAHMGFRSLRVINDDTIAPGRGFGAHGHRDMEIITYILEGALAHKDSMGQQHTIGPNTVQAMSAGSGIVHSEFNASQTDPVHLIQIWIEPAVEDVEPSYQEFSFAPEQKLGRLLLLAAPDPSPEGGSAVIHQDARAYVTKLGSGEKLSQALPANRHAWVHVAQGNACVNGHPLHAGDAAALSGEAQVSLSGEGAGGAEILLFDLA